tara:strand:- start:13605 stop:13808 length:204 start_codon:yes stop_codon:yes gene_type:complete
MYKKKQIIKIIEDGIYLDISSDLVADKILFLFGVGCSFCEDISKGSFYLGQTCEQCNRPFRVVKNKQ